MEWTIRSLNLLSAVLMLATAIYVQVGFAGLLSPVTRLAIVVGALVYFLLRLDQLVVRGQEVLPSVEQ